MMDILEITFPVLALLSCIYIIYIDRKNFKEESARLNTIEKEIEEIENKIGHEHA